MDWLKVNFSCIDWLRIGWILFWAIIVCYVNLVIFEDPEIQIFIVIIGVFFAIIGILAKKLKETIEKYIEAMFKNTFKESASSGELVTTIKNTVKDTLKESASSGELVTTIKNTVKDTFKESASSGELKKTIEDIIDERGKKSKSLCACVERIIKSDDIMNDFIRKLDKTIKNKENKEKTEKLIKSHLLDLTKKWPKEHIVSISTYLNFGSGIYETTANEIQKVYIVNYLQPYEFLLPTFFDTSANETREAFTTYTSAQEKLRDTAVVERITIINDEDYLDGNFILTAYRNATARLGREKAKTWFEGFIYLSEVTNLIKDIKKDITRELKQVNNVEEIITTHLNGELSKNLFVAILDGFIERYHTTENSQRQANGVKYSSAMYMLKSGLNMGTYKLYSPYLDKDYVIIEYGESEHFKIGLETEIASYVLVKVTDGIDFRKDTWEELLGKIRSGDFPDSGYLEKLSDDLNEVN